MFNGSDRYALTELAEAMFDDPVEALFALEGPDPSPFTFDHEYGAGPWDIEAGRILAEPVAEVAQLDQWRELGEPPLVQLLDGERTLDHHRRELALRAGDGSTNNHEGEAA